MMACPLSKLQRLRGPADRNLSISTESSPRPRLCGKNETQSTSQGAWDEAGPGHLKNAASTLRRGFAVEIQDRILCLALTPTPSSHRLYTERIEESSGFLYLLALMSKFPTSHHLFVADRSHRSESEPVSGYVTSNTRPIAVAPPPSRRGRLPRSG